MTNGTMTRIDTVKTASGLNVVAGIWLILAPFILGYANLVPAFWNDVVVGILLVVLAGIRVANPNQYVGLSWTNLGLGIWLILAPFILDYAVYATPMWNDIMVGIVAACLAVWSAVSTPSSRPLMR